jgi:DNA adenine methylase
MVYVGSKERLSKYIIPILQNIIDDNKIETYIEPFVGGANIIDKIRCKNRLGNDLHIGLIEIYKAVQRGWIPPATITECDYQKAKNGLIPEPLKSYIGFNGSFGSKYFGGFARCFKNDGITPRDRYFEKTSRFLKQIPLLQSIEFSSGEYFKLEIPDNSLIYCDPPYEGTQGYSVNKFKHNIFWEWVRQQTENNFVLVSEFTAPNDFMSIWNKERKCSLDINTGSKSAIENLFKLKK